MRGDIELMGGPPTRENPEMLAVLYVMIEGLMIFLLSIINLRVIFCKNHPDSPYL